MTDTYTRLHQQVTDRGPWMQTASGGSFMIACPDPGDVRLMDIAHALSNQCRYNGHVQKFYSVAQHATLVAKWMLEDNWMPHVALAGLHHDSAEAYTGDLVSQIKWAVPQFKRLEASVEEAVRIGLDLPRDEYIWKATKKYDFVALATEVRDVLGPNRTEFSWGDLPEPRKDQIVPLSPEEAKHAFLSMDEYLRELINNQED